MNLVFTEILANRLVAFQRNSELAGCCKSTSFLDWRWSGTAARSVFRAAAVVAGIMDAGGEMLGARPQKALPA